MKKRINATVDPTVVQANNYTNKMNVNVYSDPYIIQSLYLNSQLNEHQSNAGPTNITHQNYFFSMHPLFYLFYFINFHTRICFYVYICYHIF